MLHNGKCRLIDSGNYFEDFGKHSRPHKKQGSAVHPVQAADVSRRSYVYQLTSYLVFFFVFGNKVNFNAAYFHADSHDTFMQLFGVEVFHIHFGVGYTIGVGAK